MINAFPKMLAAVGTAAFLVATPVAAQSGGEAYPSLGVYFERLNPDKHRDMHERFIGLGSPASKEGNESRVAVGGEVPRGTTTYPVPEEIYGEMPEARNYEYFVLPGDRVALVHPETRTVEAILE